jgi:hypothetical protein
VGRQIAMNAKIVFKLHVTDTPGFHSHYDCCNQKMWLCSGAPDDPEGETVMNKHGADALCSAAKSIMHAIRTEGKEAQQDAVH